MQDERWHAAHSSIIHARPALTEAAIRRTSRFLTAGLLVTGAGEPKLYVTRPGAIGRALRNDGEPRDELGGFATVDPGSLSWPEQVDPFRSACQVVGIHGAALTNIIFRAARADHCI